MLHHDQSVIFFAVHAVKPYSPSPAHGNWNSNKHTITKAYNTWQRDKFHVPYTWKPDAGYSVSHNQPQQSTTSIAIKITDRQTNKNIERHSGWWQSQIWLMTLNSKLNFDVKLNTQTLKLKLNYDMKLTMTVRYQQAADAARIREQPMLVKI